MLFNHVPYNIKPTKNYKHEIYILLGMAYTAELSTFITYYKI